MRLTFRLDKHNQLRVTASEDFVFNEKEPDILVLSQKETEKLKDFLVKEYAE